MGKSWKTFGETKKHRPSRADREEERRLCRERVTWTPEVLEEEEEEEQAPYWRVMIGDPRGKEATEGR